MANALIRHVTEEGKNMSKVSKYYRQRCELIAKCAEAMEERSGGPSITSREMWDSAARYLETAILIENEGPHVENPWTLADVTERSIV